MINDLFLEYTLFSNFPKRVFIFLDATIYIVSPRGGFHTQAYSYVIRVPIPTILISDHLRRFLEVMPAQRRV